MQPTRVIVIVTHRRRRRSDRRKGVLEGATTEAVDVHDRRAFLLIVVSGSEQGRRDLLRPRGHEYPWRRRECGFGEFPGRHRDNRAVRAGLVRPREG